MVNNLLSFSIVVVSLTATLIVCLPRGNKRIWGGEISSGSDDVPHLVSICKENKLHKRNNTGVGAILSDRFVITAARSVANETAEELLVLVVAYFRSFDGQLYKVENTFIREPYTPSTDLNDLALLKTQDPITFSLKVAPISISADHVGGRMQAVLNGFHTHYGLKLLPIQRTTLENVDCEKELLPKYAVSLSDTQLCAKARYPSVCDGDWGPLLNENGELIGFFSKYYECDNRYPEVYTRVGEYKEWIDSVMSSAE